MIEFMEFVFDNAEQSLLMLLVIVVVIVHIVEAIKEGRDEN